MTSDTSPATAWSLGFLARLAHLGVDHIVVSPGSRSQALALAAEALSRPPYQALHVYVAIDERVAGFLGLGLAIESGEPVALLCTSGSAPAHYFPALIEAKHSGVSLIALTADRPAELRGVGANQTTTQPGMFGPGVHHVIDLPAPEGIHGGFGDSMGVADQAYEKATSGGPHQRSGPIQINVAFREPLSSAVTQQLVNDAITVARAKPEPSEDNREGLRSIEIHERHIALEPQPGTLVIAGHLAGPEAEALARELRAPLLPEVHSGARFGPHLVVAYRELLREPPQGAVIRRVVTVGRPTLSREVQELLSSSDIEHVVWQRGEPEPANPSGVARVVDSVAVTEAVDREVSKEWVLPWVRASRRILSEQSLELDPPSPDVALVESDDMADRARFATNEMTVVRWPLTRRHIAREVWEATWPHDQLVLGSSRMIREFDKVVPGKNIPVWSNRGVSGIDGTIATARGIAQARAISGVTGITRVVLGDLALIHDAGSLLLDSGEADESKLQVIVVRDGGGSLFDLLEARQSADRDAFERVLFTPASVNIEALAGAYGWKYRLCATLGDLVEALADPRSPMLVDCVVPREEQPA